MPSCEGLFDVRRSGTLAAGTARAKGAGGEHFQREAMGMRVFTATLGTETNTFAPLPTGLAAFKGAGYDPSAVATADLQAFAMIQKVVRERAATDGWDVREGKVAFAQPGGMTTRAAYEALRDDLLADLKAAMAVDMVLLQLHGAMIADGYDDAEGDLLARVRQMVGPKVVVAAELDPHCHLTERKVANADILVLFKEYPHTDIYARAQEVVALAEATHAGRIKPVMSVVDLGMIAVFHTSREPARGFVDRMSALEGRDGVLSVSIAHGFPWGDVADMGTRVLVVTDGRKAAGDALAAKLGAEIVAMRDALTAPYPDADAAITQGLASNAMPIVLADSADNPGGGAAGDSTFILERLIARGVDNAVLGPLWDPVAVDICFDVGVGARIPLRIGGKIGPTSGQPVDAEVVVLALKRNAVQSGLSGTIAPLGDVAVVAIGGIKVVLNTQRGQAFGTDLFTQFGIDLAQTRLVVVKSSQHFFAKFGPVAKKVIYVETPGTCPFDFAGLPYKRARPAIWKPVV